MSRIIGDQWRRLPHTEREKYDERARERAREQESSVPNHLPVSYDTPIHPQRLVNGGASMTVNGYYPSMSSFSLKSVIDSMIVDAIPVLLKPPPPAPPVVNVPPPRVQRLAHSETYARYIDHLKNDHPFIFDWPKQLKATITNNNGNVNPRTTLPSHWLMNNSPGFHNNVYEALWSMRDNMWSDVVRVRNVLSDEW